MLEQSRNGERVERRAARWGHSRAKPLDVGIAVEMGGLIYSSLCIYNTATILKSSSRRLVRMDIGGGLERVVAPWEEGATNLATMSRGQRLLPMLLAAATGERTESERGIPKIIVNRHV